MWVWNPLLKPSQQSTGMVSFTHRSWTSCYHSSISCHKFCTQTPQSTSSDPGKGSCQLTSEVPACMTTEPVQQLLWLSHDSTWQPGRVSLTKECTKVFEIVWGRESTVCDGVQSIWGMPLSWISLGLISMQSDVGITLQELYNQALFNTIGKTMKWQA